MKRLLLVVQSVGTVSVVVLVTYGFLGLVRYGPLRISVSAEGQEFAAPSGGAAIPDTINYQGFLREPNGSLTTGNYTITARIYDEPAPGSGTLLYETIVPDVTVRDGLFNIVLGDDPPLEDGDLTEAPRYIGIKLNEGAELIPRQRLHAVPWAMLASRASEAATLVEDASVGDLTVTNGLTVTSPGGIAVTGPVTTTIDPTDGIATTGSLRGGTLHFTEGDLVIPHGSTLSYGSLDDFRLIYRQDFESGNNDDWRFGYDMNFWGRALWNTEPSPNYKANTTTTGYNTVLLGCAGYPVTGPLSYGELYRFLTLPDGNQEVVVRLTYYSFDGWDDAVGWVMIDGVDGSGTRITPASWFRSMHYSEFGRRAYGCQPDIRDAAHFVELRAATEASAIRISVNSNIPGYPNFGGVWMSFGIDNVEVWVR